MIVNNRNFLVRALSATVFVATVAMSVSSKCYARPIITSGNEDPRVIIEDWPADEVILETSIGAGDSDSVLSVVTSILQRPHFPGGEEKMYKYIYEHLTYPPEHAESGIQGRVVVRIFVKSDGSIGEIKIEKSLDEFCDAEAIRVVESFPKFIPARSNGHPVEEWYTIPIYFKLSQ